MSHGSPSGGPATLAPRLTDGVVAGVARARMHRIDSTGGKTDLRVHAYSLAYLFALGGTLVVVTVAVDQPAGQDTTGLLGIAVVAYFAAAVLRFLHRWLPEWSYAAFVFLGT